MKIAAITLVLMGSVAFAQESKTPPATQPDGYQTGLVREVYTLPRRPKKLRNEMAGLAPKDVGVAPTPRIESGADLAEHTGNVQANFEGEIHIPTTGEYTFRADADDMMEVAIDDTVVITDVWINGSKEPSRKTVKLSQGWHPFRARFFQGDGGFNMRLRWTPPGASDLVDVPADQFRVTQARIDAARALQTSDGKVDPAHPHRTVFTTRGFFELPEEQGDLLVELLEGPTKYSDQARKDFANTITATNYEKLPYWHQMKVLAGFLRGWYSGQTVRGDVSHRAEYKLSEPQALEYDGWRGAKRQGFKHVATIEGKNYVIYTPAADSVERESVAQGIASLPKTLRILLDYVTVEPYGTANEFNGGGNNMWVRRKESTPASMIENVFSHEIGHILMNKTDNYLAWEKAIAADILTPSEYARMNPSEDFADFTRMYLSTEGDAKQIASLRKLFPNRLPLMEETLAKVQFEWPKAPATQQAAPSP